MDFKYTDINRLKVKECKGYIDLYIVLGIRKLTWLYCYQAKQTPAHRVLLRIMGHTHQGSTQHEDIIIINVYTPKNKQIKIYDVN